MSRQLKKTKKLKVYDPRNLSYEGRYALADSADTMVYIDKQGGWVVQAAADSTPGCKGTPWEGTLRVAVKHSLGRNPKQYESRDYSVPISWDDLQAIKDHLWPDRIAIEIYPPQGKVVDVADIRWLWVLPAGAVLPFNLDAASPNLLSSGDRRGQE